MGDFDRFVEAIDYPMFIVTVPGPNGCLVGFATQCSIHPPRFLVGLSEKNRTHQAARDATHLGVHVLGRDDKALAELFGGETGDDVDKFAECRWSEGPHGVPILDGIAAWFVGRILDRVDLGDHTGHVLEPVVAQPAETENLEYSDAKDIAAGHPPDE